ncbi:protein LAZY 1-like [Olea europaea var. sylvestris]|uniref:protein LAZY 1-like n=1 Tax=Olea europaea var. sylvestris TaxID=158386 RepID=UPI000C1CDBC2|nr:protein LAZY 1-like [Olea europaea var. sylvestris]
MKLLGWMHRKFRQNNNETLKEFSIGNSCTCLTGQPSLDDINCYPKTNYCGKPFSKLEIDNHVRNSFSGQGAKRVEEEDLEEESSAVLTELFHGFLAIGTLGTEPVTIDPATPKFSIFVDDIAEKETEVTENELKVINDELEKVLGAEARDESCNISSGRNSQVSAGRSSHCSTITLSGKPIEGAESNGNGAIICPLQSYLFGSAIGYPETVPQAKNEHRTSLRELFQKTTLEDENSGTKFDQGEKRKDKETDKSALHLIKKLLKRKNLHTSSRSSTTGSEGTIDSASVETRLHKVCLMLLKTLLHSFF